MKKTKKTVLSCVVTLALLTAIELPYSSFFSPVRAQTNDGYFDNLTVYNRNPYTQGNNFATFLGDITMGDPDAPSDQTITAANFVSNVAGPLESVGAHYQNTEVLQAGRFGCFDGFEYLIDYHAIRSVTNDGGQPAVTHRDEYCQFRGANAGFGLGQLTKTETINGEQQDVEYANGAYMVAHDDADHVTAVLHASHWESAYMGTLRKVSGAQATFGGSVEIDGRGNVVFTLPPPDNTAQTWELYFAHQQGLGAPDAFPRPDYQQIIDALTPP